MNNDKLIREISKKRKELEEAKDEKSRLEGRLDEHYSQLENEFGCKNTKEAEKRLKKFEDEIEEKQEQLKSGIEEWKEEYQKGT